MLASLKSKIGPSLFHHKIRLYIYRRVTERETFFYYEIICGHMCVCVCVCVCVCALLCVGMQVVCVCVFISVNIVKVCMLYKYLYLYPVSLVTTVHAVSVIPSTVCIIMVLLPFFVMNQVYFFCRVSRCLDWTECFLGSLICLAMFLISTETVTVRACLFHQCTLSQTCAHIKIDRKEEKRRETSVCVWISLYCILDIKI